MPEFQRPQSSSTTYSPKVGFELFDSPQIGFDLLELSPSTILLSTDEYLLTGWNEMSKSRWLKLAESAFSFWNNPADEIWDKV